MRQAPITHLSSSPRRSQVPGGKVGGCKPVHPAGFLNSGIRLPRLAPAVPREICLGDPDAALRLLAPLLKDDDRGATGRDFLLQAEDRLAAPFAALLSKECGLTVSLCDTPSAYENTVGNREDGSPVAGSLLVSFRDYVHEHAFVGEYLLTLPPALAEWVVAFLYRLPMVLGPGDYRQLVERVTWAGEDNELCRYSDWGELSEFDEWAKLTDAQKALVERALKLGDRATLEELLKPGFTTLREFEAAYPAWVLEPAKLEGNQTQALETLAAHDLRLAEALGSFFPNGELIAPPKRCIHPEGCEGYLGIAFWRRHDLIAHTFDEEYEQMMQGGEEHPYFARVDFEPIGQSIRDAQEAVREVLEYNRNILTIFTLLEEREPSKSTTQAP